MTHLEYLERHRGYNAKYREKNREKLREARREYYRTHREQELERANLYHKRKAFC